uniref:Presenilin n=1 Tax=Parastrongyloides trichosuri TaxID=131310 RepID=A0A0N4ZSD0_PARTI
MSNEAPIPLRNLDETEDEKDEINLKYNASHVISLFIPVTICMSYVVFCIKFLPFYGSTEKFGQQLVYTPFREEGAESFWHLMLVIIGNSAVMLAYIITVTTIIIILYKKRFYKVIDGFLFFNTALFLTFFLYLHLQETFTAFSIPIDVISLILITGNLCIMGIISIHFKGPLIIQQTFLILIAAMFALILIKFMPNWTVWGILLLISFWDLFAVLYSKGPLRILVETAQERNEPIFASLIYTSGLVYVPITTVMIAEDNVPVNEETNEEEVKSGETSIRYAPGRPQNALVFMDEQNGSGSSQTRPENKNERLMLNGVYQQHHHEEEHQGVKLGLGDFVFYSILLGKAATFNDWNLVIICYVSILVGLSLTLILLALHQKALPALPISIFFGLILFFSTRLCISPFIFELLDNNLIY